MKSPEGYKPITVYAPNDGQSHLCKITVNGDGEEIEWLLESNEKHLPSHHPAEQGGNWPENYELDHPGEKPIVQPIAYYKKKHYHSSHPYANWEEEYNHDCLMLERWEKNYDLYLKSKSQRSGSEPTAGELYRWVKASERLPEKWSKSIVRNFKTGKVKVCESMGHYLAFDAGFSEWSYANCEWLEKLPSQPVDDLIKGIEKLENSMMMKGGNTDGEKLNWFIENVKQLIKKEK